MAIDVIEIEPGDEAWRVDLKVYEGVYKKDRYSVRVVDIPRPPVDWTLDQQKNAVMGYVRHEVTQHMRRGSLPPTGMQLDGEKVWEREA